MRVFVTGATGFIGSAVVAELIGAGHGVLGMTRSEEGARRLEAAGAEPYHAVLEEPDGVARGAAAADGVLHLGFDHDWSRRLENCEKDARNIKAMGAALAGSGRPLIITSGVGAGSRGGDALATEDVLDREHANPRIASELAAGEALAAGASVASVRLPQVHDTRRAGIVTALIAIARAKGVSAYVGDGANRVAAAHVRDVARLYRLALERHEAGARWHAVDEEGVAARQIVEAIGRGLGVPVVSLSAEEAAAHFGWMGPLVAMNLSASSAWTRARLGWTPSGPGLLADLAATDYAAVGAG